MSNPTITNTPNTSATTPVDPQLTTGPISSRYWECPARYSVNHHHRDGRPLCSHCHCWNPALFPNGQLPRPLPSTTSSNSPISMAFTSTPTGTQTTSPPLPPLPTTMTHIQSAPTSTILRVPSESFPTLKLNSSVVESARQGRLPSQSNYPLIPRLSKTILQTKASKTNLSIPFQRMLQVVCGAVPEKHDYDNQLPKIRYKNFTVVGKEIWRPSSDILDEQSGHSTDELSLAQLLYSKVLTNSTSFLDWLSLYQNQHNRKLPYQQSCYMVSSWNKQ